MSVEFSLTGSSLTLENWDSLVNDANDWDFNEHSDPNFSESGGAHVLVPGSIRGVVLFHRGEPANVTFRLGALSSSADWKAAYALLSAALKQGAGTLAREDGTALKPVDLLPSLAEQAAQANFVTSVQQVAKMLAEHAAQAAGTPAAEGAEAEMALPMGRFSLPLRASDIAPDFGPDDVPGLESVLAGRVARFSQAHHAKTMTLEGGVKVSTWAEVDTLVSQGAHLIACSAFDSESQGMLPADRLVQILPGAEALGGGGLFLPEFELGKIPELKAALEKELVTVEAWTAANADQLKAEREAEAAAEEASEYESYRGLLMFVVGGVGKGDEPPAIAAELEGRGVPQNVARNMVSLVGVALEHLFDDSGPRDPSVVLAELVAEGIPEGLAVVALDVIVRGMVPPEGAGEAPSEGAGAE